MRFELERTSKGSRARVAAQWRVGGSYGVWAVGVFESQWAWLHRGNSRGTIVLAGGSLRPEWSVFSGVASALRFCLQSPFFKGHGSTNTDSERVLFRWCPQPPQPLISALPPLSELAGCDGNTLRAAADSITLLSERSAGSFRSCRRRGRALGADAPRSSFKVPSWVWVLL